MEERNIPVDAVFSVLAKYHTSRPAPFRVGARRAIIYVGEFAGRDLKVYVVENSDPPLVTTVVWQGEEQ